ncbi:MAG: 16S rRNA (guanine(966)-N(2))-methyltransferase RsmD [Firmicutes bacterium]|nr:16S rRNA (guanine(966)-N(2))-methyltransferase RsmD [Bacillota bacterium]
MRVITGSARGMRIETLSGDEVRPTTDKVKEAMFNIIQFQLEGRRVLDLFAGSGQLGIEALSRGAAQAVFVDVSRQSVERIKENLNHTKLMKNARVVNSDFAAFLRGKTEPFDVAFLDPPYRKGLVQQALPLVANVMNPGGVILCESPREEDLSGLGGDFVLRKEYCYGKIKLSRFTHRDQAE